MQSVTVNGRYSLELVVELTLRSSDGAWLMSELTGGHMCSVLRGRLLLEISIGDNLSFLPYLTVLLLPLFLFFSFSFLPFFKSSYCGVWELL